MDLDDLGGAGIKALARGIRWLAWAAGLALSLVPGLACRTVPTAAPGLPFGPSCALVAGEVSAVAAPWNPWMYISQRRGPPNDDGWEYLIVSHKPSGPPGSPDFVWGAMFDFKEVTLPLPNAAYQVHDLVLAPGPALTIMTQDANGVWRSPVVLVAPANTVPSGQPGGPLGTDQGRVGKFRRVSAAAVGGKLHICTVEEQGQLERNIFDPATNRFDGWTDIEMATNERGRFVDVACAAVQNPTTAAEELHVCGVTDDGKLWHASESPFRTFSPLGDVKEQSGDVGEFRRVDCAGSGGQLHLVGLTRDGRAWHTARIPARWSPFVNVAEQASPGPPLSSDRFFDVAIGICNEGVPPEQNRDVSQLNVVLTQAGPAGGRARIWHTIRAANPVEWNPGSPATTWRPLNDLDPRINRTASSPVPPQSNPMLWGGFSIGFRPFRPY